ncbi:MAG: efflux RND transporter permease subunit [Planctomycetota bacterium]|nr:MAG: efflux RND transporter permease subunit [Planctomycetota bacterium]
MFERLARLAVDNPVTVHLVSLLLLVGGVASYVSRPQEIFPEFTRERIRITTVYPGASPEDVEELVTVKVEDALAGVEEIERIESTSQEGVSTVVGRLPSGADVRRVLQDVDRAVQAIEDLPDDAEEPLVEEVKTRFPVITLSLYGEVSELALKDLARPLQRKLEAIPGVAYARPTGERELEWHVNVRGEDLLRYELTLSDVAAALAAHNLNLPAGTLEGSSGDVLLRTRGETRTARQIESVVVRARPDGAVVRLADVADVVPGFARARTLGRLNGKPALNLTVLKDKSGNIIEIASAVRELAAGLELPPGVRWSLHTDMSVFLASRLRTMQRNALQGFFLVLLSLCVLLEWRMALLVACGIPLAFLATFVAMAILGISINMMSLFAMILILGMLVDDAIIVTENIYRRIESGEAPTRAAVLGTAEVARPVLATILTTVSAFLPMLLTPGEMGRWVYVVPVVVTLCLTASALECFLILPCHVAEFARPTARRVGWFEAALGRYERLVRAALAQRWPLLAGTVGGTLILLAVSLTFVEFTLFGKFNSDIQFINFELPTTASLRETSERARSIEEIALALAPEERSSVATNVGIAAVDYNRADTGSYLGQVVVTFAPEEERTRTIPEMVEWMREKVEALPGFTKVEFKGLQAGPGGKAIEVALGADDPVALQRASAEVQAWLRAQPGVYGIYDDAVPGKRELELRVDPEAAAAVGLTTADVAAQVRARFQGLEATTFRRFDDDVPLVVRLPLRERRLRQSLEEAWLRGSGGQRVPLAAVASVREHQGLSKIVRNERQRAVTVLADVDLERANALDVTEKLRARFAEDLSRRLGVELTIKGQRREAERSMRGLMEALGIALLLIYLILGTQFKSFTQPLFVMVAIPFGIDGILFGHMITGRDLTFLSMMGLVATSGIVVNDSLVLVDLINRLRAQGLPIFEAAVRGSVQRLRPILLTSITTILGLTPLAFFASGQARFLSPMAISIVFGLSFGTFLTLLVVPALYLIRDDLLARASRDTRPGEGPEAAEA